MPFYNSGVCWFRTTSNGSTIFVVGPYGGVVRMGPYEGAVFQANGLWPPGGIETVEVTDDVASWLADRP